MNDVLEYKGYKAVVGFDLEGECFHGLVLGTRDVISFEATNVQDLKHEFQASIDDYLQFCEEEGLEPDAQPSGQFRFRPGPDLHRQIAVAAGAANISINEWLIEVAESHVQQATV